jgi:hypothetical protein
VRGRRAALVLALATPGCFSLLFDAGDLPDGPAADAGQATDVVTGRDAAQDGALDAFADAATACGPSDFCDDFEEDGLVSLTRWSRQSIDKGTLALDDARFKNGTRGLSSVVPPAPKIDGGSYTFRRAWLERDLASRSSLRCTFWVLVTAPAKSDVSGVDFFHLIASDAALSGYEIHFGIAEGKSQPGFREDVYYPDGGEEAPRIKRTLEGVTFSGWTHVSFAADLEAGTLQIELRDTEGAVVGGLVESNMVRFASPPTLAVRLGVHTKDPQPADMTFDDLRCEDAL